MIEIRGAPCAPRRFASLLTPLEVLYQFDGPRIFVARARDESLALMYLSDEDESGVRFVAAPTSQSIVQRLKLGRLDVLGALEQPWVWIVDRTHRGRIVRVTRTDLTEMPRDALPAPGAMLWPELDPLITIRMQGPGLTEGEVPSSVVSRIVESATTALRALAEYTLAGMAFVGRPAEQIRRLTDLRTQQIRYGSFAVSFRPPVDQLDMSSKSDADRTFERLSQSLLRGLVWLGATDEGLPDTLPEQERRAILRALDALAPPPSGPITTVELAGRVVASMPKRPVLNRQDRSRIRESLQRLSPEARRLRGQVRAINLDRQTLTIRVGTRRTMCNYDPAQLPDIFKALESESIVTALGMPGSPAGAQLQLVSLVLDEEPSMPSNTERK